MRILEKIKSAFKRKSGGKASGAISDFRLGIIMALIIAGLSFAGSFEKYELLALDEMFRIRGFEAPSDKIIIIEIEDHSLEILGRWPWPRSHHASFLDILDEARPAVVIFDILFPEADPENDGTFAAVAEKTGNVYLAAYFSLEKYAPPAPLSEDLVLKRMPSVGGKVKDKNRYLKASSVTLPVAELADSAKRISIVNVPSDPDGATRHLPLLIEFGEKLYPALSLQIASDYLGVDTKDIKVEPNSIVLPVVGNPIRIPVDSKASMVINYCGPINTFERYSYVQVIQDYNRLINGEEPVILNKLKGKIIFIGHTATGTIDSRIMPFSNAYPAVGVHASALSNILKRNFMRRAGVSTNMLTILLLGGMLSALLRKGRKALTNFGIMLAVFFAYAVSAFVLFAYLDFWINSFAPLVAIIFIYVGLTANQYSAIRYEKRVLENELLIARAIQQSFLPKNYPQVQFLEFAARCLPAKHIGGDLYDFITLENGKIGVVIGDVSGKGVPAALYMARTISEFRTTAHFDKDPAETLRILNDAVSKEGMEKSFITMQYVTIDLKSKEFLFSNAGHNTIIHFINNSRKIEEIDTEGGMPIGVMEGIDFYNKQVPMEKGDILFLYSDGVSEAMDKNRKEFGLNRVKDILLANYGLGALDIMSKVLTAIEIFSKGAPQHDDITVIVIKAV
ncbi:MAG: CHASE2 domain-containing protein [Candidatus Omnitrophica bacterium]|nr:CHASE2 domain-containing protein [Candidatus Omnitrophota bacterium]MCG2705233.1 CHASE2 domain-containing protein [Candidatus Omnitrophota bacterium]